MEALGGSPSVGPGPRLCTGQRCATRAISALLLVVPFLAGCLTTKAYAYWRESPTVVPVVDREEVRKDYRGLGIPTGVGLSKKGDLMLLFRGGTRAFCTQLPDPDSGSGEVDIFWNAIRECSGETPRAMVPLVAGEHVIPIPETTAAIRIPVRIESYSPAGLAGFSGRALRFPIQAASGWITEPTAYGSESYMVLSIRDSAGAVFTFAPANGHLRQRSLSRLPKEMRPHEVATNFGGALRLPGRNPEPLWFRSLPGRPGPPLSISMETFPTRRIRKASLSCVNGLALAGRTALLPIAVLGDVALIPVYVGFVIYVALGGKIVPW